MNTQCKIVKCKIKRSIMVKNMDQFMMDIKIKNIKKNRTMKKRLPKNNTWTTWLRWDRTAASLRQIMKSFKFVLMQVWPS
jgi:hypothetical protein